MLILCAACAQTDAARIQQAAKAVADVRAAQIWPKYPDECRRISRSGIVEGDRLDVAVLKLDAALARQNARTRRCADWYDGQAADATAKTAE